MKRFLFHKDSPCVKYEMEKMYLSNKKLIQYSDKNEVVSTFDVNSVKGASMLVIFGLVALGSYVINQT